MKPLSPLPACRRAAIGITAALIQLAPLQAQVTVTTLADENDLPAGAQVSLREALRDATEPGTVTFDPALSGKVFVLSLGPLVLSLGENVTVTGSGNIVIDARRRSRIFEVNAGATLALSGITLQNGLAPGDGGAILNAGTLSLTDCVLRDNAAKDGSAGTPGFTSSSINVSGGPGWWGGPGFSGGAISSTGSLTALRCTFNGNTAGQGGYGGRGGDVRTDGRIMTLWSGDGGAGGAGGTGGAILSTGALQLVECLFESNTSGAGGRGGEPGTFQYPASAGRTGNGGNAGSGGALSHTGNVSIERCSFTGNRCRMQGSPGGMGYGGTAGKPGSGHAVFWQTGTATLTNCTVSGNGASEYPYGQSLSENGAAVAAGAGTLLQLVHCTVTGNRSGTGTVSGGIAASVPVQCLNTIVSGNLLDRNTTGSTPVWEEVNFSTGTQRTLTPPGSLGSTTGVDAKLGPPSVIPGNFPLPALVPLAGSPALNTGATLANPPATDQRGLPRTAGIPDLGAVEVQESEPASLVAQSISFSPPLNATAASLNLSATASSGLPVSLSLISGPATLEGGTLTFTGGDFAIVEATQPGNGTTAPARSALRIPSSSHRKRNTCSFPPVPSP